MNLSEACAQMLDQPAMLVEEIHERDFTKPSEALSDFGVATSTVRHREAAVSSSYH